MSARALRAALLAVSLAPLCYGQFQLYVVNGSTEAPTPAVYDLGGVYPNVAASAHFRVRNTSGAAATLSVLAVAGAGFTLSGPVLPARLAPQTAVDFTVTFLAPDTGSYSAVLRSEGISLLLLATVLPRLTYEVDTGTGLQALGAAPVDFGPVELGSSAKRHFTIVNQMAAALLVPAITLPAGDFALSGAAPSGLALQPGQSADFYVQFSPTATGARTGSLTAGDSTYALSGTGVPPPLPNPRLSISLPRTLSAQQGAVTVTLDATSRTSGSGTLTLDFQPGPGTADDAAIVFASGGRTAAFTVSPGDSQGYFSGQPTAPFQTGTTAGVLVFAVQLGGAEDHQSLAIPPASVGIASVEGVRAAAGVEVRITGFDNTRTAGPLTFTFFDAAGNAVSPGAIRSDATSSFAGYFRNSSLGGVFLLTALFPVTGDPSLVSGFQAQVANSAGTAQTARIEF